MRGRSITAARSRGPSKTRRCCCNRLPVTIAWISSVDKAVPDCASGIVAQFRLGMPPQFYDHVDDDVAGAIDDAIAVLKKMTEGSREVGLPLLLCAGAGAEMAAYQENLRDMNG